MMGLKKFTALIILPLICVAFLSSQSLVEAAKKEKERRAKIKKKSTKVVTNADLKKRKNSPAVETAIVQETEPEKARQDTGIIPEEDHKKQQPKKDIVKEEPAKSDHFKQKYDKARERVELLLNKMNGLWQKYNNPDDMTPKPQVQSEIAQTYLQLQKAQKEAEAAEKELDRAMPKEDKSKKL